MNFLKAWFLVNETWERDATTSYGFLMFVSSLLHGDSVQYRPMEAPYPMTLY